MTHDTPKVATAKTPPMSAARAATLALEKAEYQKTEPAKAGPTQPEANKAAPPAAQAATPESAAAAQPQAAAKVLVPSSAHVRVDVPKGLQAWLDADTRMQPWVNQVMNVANQCYAKVRQEDASAGGVIVVLLTMHKDDRPDADIKTLPPALSGVVACATGDLMRTHMPLFTGTEGDKQTVRIHFE